MFQHAVHLSLSEKSPSREKLDSSLIAQEEKQLSSSLLVVYKEFTLRCLKRDPGLSLGTSQTGCIGLYTEQAMLGSKFQMRDTGLSLSTKNS